MNFIFHHHFEVDSRCKFQLDCGCGSGGDFRHFVPQSRLRCIHVLCRCSSPVGQYPKCRTFKSFICSHVIFHLFRLPFYVNTSNISCKTDNKHNTLQSTCNDCIIFCWMRENGLGVCHFQFCCFNDFRMQHSQQYLTINQEALFPLACALLEVVISSCYVWRVTIIQLSIWGLA